MGQLKSRLKKIISGAQDGADLAGIYTGKEFGYETGGTMPKGYKTLKEFHPEYASFYGMSEHSSEKYPPRTYANVRDSDGTLRFASDFKSPGELCTAKAIRYYGKPWLDINVITPILGPQDVVDWLIEKEIVVLNVAGNTDRTCPNIFDFVHTYLKQVFELCERS